MGEAVVILNFLSKNTQIDIAVPLEITANEFVVALNEAYKLGINTEDISKCYLRSENPIALLKGDTSLKKYRIHNGSIINID